MSLTPSKKEWQKKQTENHNKAVGKWHDDTMSTQQSRRKNTGCASVLILLIIGIATIIIVL